MSTSQILSSIDCQAAELKEEVPPGLTPGLTPGQAGFWLVQSWNVVQEIRYESRISSTIFLSEAGRPK